MPACPDRSALARWGKMLTNIVLPRHCVLCGQRSGSRNACGPCLSELPRIGHCCSTCALSLQCPEDDRCGACLLKPPPWDSAIAALEYRYPVDRLVQRFKFHRDLACGHLLGLELLQAVRHRTPRRPDFLLPVPLHRRRHWRRTFNQAELMAGTLSAALSIPIDARLLARARHTPAQSGLDAMARRSNLRGAFRCRSGARVILSGRRVALIDDVFTTGATLTECTRTLMRAGASEVAVWVAARAPGR